MLDTLYTRMIDSANMPVSETSGFIEEGKALLTDPSLFDGTQMCVGVMAAPTADSKFVGFAYSYYTVPTVDTFVDCLSVPATADSNGNYTVTLSNTPNVTSYSILVKDENGTVYTADTSTTVGAGKYFLQGNTVYFNAASKGLSVTFIYNFNISVLQAQFRYGDGVAGHTVASDYTQGIGVLRAAQIATTCFNSSVDYSGAVTLKVGANGNVDPSYDTNAVEIPNSYVIAPPSVDAPSLRMYFKA